MIQHDKCPHGDSLLRESRREREKLGIESPEAFMEEVVTELS